MPPTALINSIDSVRKRARLLSLLYGVGIVIASAVGLLVGVVLVDYLLNLKSIPRVLTMLGSVGVLGWLVYRYITQPAMRSVSLSDVAGRLERAFPQFEDRLRSTVNFVEGGNPGSGVLQQRVMEQAAQIAGDVDLGKAIVARPAMLSVGGAALSIVLTLAIALGALDRNILSIITGRLVTPFAGIAWPKRVQINVTSNVPQRVPVGQKIELSMLLDRGDKASLKPIVYYQIEGGPRQQMFMTRGKDGQFRASLDARLEQAATSGKLTAWIEAGDDRRDLNAITIVPRLSIKQIVAKVTPPAYVPNRTAAQQDLATGPVVTAEGAEIAIHATFNKELASAADPVLEPIGEGVKAPEIAWTRDGPHTAVATFKAVAPLRFRARATDTDGFTNTALEEYELIVRPDANLTIQLENPRRSEERTAAAFVPLQAVAEDDCGVEWVKLVVERLQPSPQKWEIPLVTSANPERDVAWQPVSASPDRTRHRVNYKWELAPLGLSAGDVIEYQVVARDNFNLDGRRHDPVGTSKLRITIISQEDLAARVTDELRQVKTQAANVRRSQQQTRQETLTLKEETKDKPDLDAADKAALDRLSQQQSSAAASAKQLAQKMQSSLDRLDENRSEAKDLKDIAAEVKETLDRTSEGAMKDAAQDLANTQQPRAEASKRDRSLDNAQQNQQKALDQLDRAMAKMENIGSLQSTIAELASILNEQRQARKDNEEIAKTNLGKKPEQMSDADRKKLEETAAKQDKLAERTEKALEQMNKQAKQMEKSDPASSDAMKSAAQQAQNSKVTANQKRAAQQTQQNQQAGAQQSQQQAELGLEQMLSELKEAERRQLARLREELAKLQQQIATLVRRQSGHNLDNLTIQGPEKLAAVDAKQVAELIELSNRKSDVPRPPEARQLTSGQELTERNTRDIAKAADAEPSTAEIGANLTKAAGKMERAIVSLRAAKLPDAYDPSQVEALAALLDAKKQVDEQKQQADDKAQQQQKDAIRARYEKIKAEQEKVNVDTARVEKARDDKGNVLRTEWPTVARLPKDQLALAEQIAKIEDDLQALGSIVYIWANKDVKNSMDEVREDLAASKTGVATQSEQTRIVEQLDAMIKNLAEKPPEKKFEDGGGGGGGGGGQGQQKPKMPTEAELKMTKSLQEAVNKSTARIDAEPKKDEAKLVALGNRQGEMRNLLDSLLQSATNGEMKLGAEPDNKDQLPEEAKVEDIDQKELEDMLGGDGGAEKKIEQDFKLVGTRMARARQRLALNRDPGAVTQEIQKRILLDLDELIEMARQNAQQQQQASSSSSSQSQQAQQDQQQANNQGANQPAQNNSASSSPDGATQTHAAGAGSKAGGTDIRESAAEWGNITPRVRDAVIESKGEAVVEQYRKLIEDYYEALSTKGTKRE